MKRTGGNNFSIHLIFGKPAYSTRPSPQPLYSKIRALTLYFNNITNTKKPLGLLNNMNDEIKYTTFRTAMGWVGILASPEGLLSTTLPQSSVEEAYRLLGKSQNQATWCPGLFEDLADRLRIYLGGVKTSFPDELDLSAASLFQRKVWGITSSIPYGETRSYRWVAEQASRPGAARAVGQALGRNPLPIIVPCHRVIASDGQLGGFSGDLEIKRCLLRLESAMGGV